MTVDRFVEERQQAWSELHALAASTRGRPERHAPSDVLRLGSLYRRAVADLAVARRRYPGDPATRRLEELVARTRPMVYDAAPRRGSLLTFFARDYWVRIRERRSLVVAAAALLFGSAFLAAMWAWTDPAGATGFVPGSFGAAEPGGGFGDISSLDAKATLSSQIFTNNIRVSFLGFAGGIAFGLGTVFVLISNGALLGVLGGLTAGAGYGSKFLELVIPHGLLELSCIVVTAAAGLRIGWALIDPGLRRRGEALMAEARPAVEIVLGTIPWLVLAGLVEGFITPVEIGLGPALAVGTILAAAFWGLVWWRGAPEPAVQASEQPVAFTPVKARVVW